MKSVLFCGKLAKIVVGAALMIGCADWVQGGTGDWPQWRGPKRDNLSTETGLLKDWPVAGPPLAFEDQRTGRRVFQRFGGGWEDLHHGFVPQSRARDSARRPKKNQI